MRSRYRSAVQWLTVACLSLASCSFLIDTSATQCEVDLDCAARGLKGATCVQHLCQPLTASSASAATTAAEQSANVTGPAADGGSSAEAGARAADMEPARSEPARAASAGAGGGTALGRSPGAAMSSRVAGAQSAAVGGRGASGAGAAAGSCAGGACGVECTDSRDCEKRGIMNGLCSGGVCYPPPPECSADADCEKRGPEFQGGRCVNTLCRPNPRWRCEPAPKTVDGDTRQIDLPVVDALSLGLMPDVRIVACDKRDLSCDRPVIAGKTDRDGHLLLTLPTNFAGYLQQTETPGYMPAMYFLPQLMPEDGVLDGFPLLRAGIAIDGLAASIGARVDNSRGHMMLIVEDCQRKPVGGVKISSPQQDASTILYYVQDNLPSTTAMATFDVGQGGFLNFPVGTATLVLTQLKTGLVLNSVSVMVRPGFISVAFMPPQSR